MKKGFLPLVAVVMSLTLTGLLVIQIVWMKQAVRLSEQQFDDHVSEALNDVVVSLERDDAAAAIIEQFARTGLLRGQKIKGSYSEYISENPYSLYDHFTLISKSLQNHPDLAVETIHIDSAVTLDDQGKWQKKNILCVDSGEFPLEIEWFAGVDSLILRAGLSEKTEYFIPDEKALLQDLIHQFYFKKKSISERLETNNLKSLIHEELQNNGIRLPFEFLVNDHLGRRILGSVDRDPEPQESVYKTVLFPGEIFNQPHYLYVFFPGQKNYINRSLAWIWMISIAFIAIIVVTFVYVLQSMLKQKKLSELKTDFINNMTHELKTPVATISLAAEMLQKEEIILNADKRSRYASIIFEENQRLGNQVEKVLQVAALEKTHFKLKVSSVDMHRLIQGITDKFHLQLENKRGVLNVEFTAYKHIIEGDEMHLSNMISNLVDNAIKYCKDYPIIKIKTENKNQGIVIRVEDKGIGMTKEAQKKVFQKFYRVPTGNIHNVKGFGLGLSYVKIISDAHFGKIKLDSELQQGSCFEVYLPLSHNPNH